MHFFNFFKVIEKKSSIQTSRPWANEQDRIAFWESCDHYLEEQECSVAGQFFEVLDELLKLSLTLFNEYEHNISCLKVEVKVRWIIMSPHNTIFIIHCVTIIIGVCLKGGVNIKLCFQS